MRKVCENCRYFKKLWAGSYNIGMSVSNWGRCTGHESDDLVKRGGKYVGKVHKNMRCQLPNIGWSADWKPRIHVPGSFKKNMSWTAHPQHRKLDKSNEYDRQWALEQEGCSR